MPIINLRKENQIKGEAGSDESKGCWRRVGKAGHE